jgi:hypothetical protein
MWRSSLDAFVKKLSNMKSDKNTCTERLRQLAGPRGRAPIHGAAVLLLCVTAGCGDGDLDTSVTNEALSRPTFFPVIGAVSFNEEDPTFGPSVAVADFNRDGNPDLALENNYTAVMVRLGDGAGGFGAEHQFNLNNPGTDRPCAVIAKDLNADGNIDLVTANQASLSVLMGNGDGTFGAATSYAILPSFFVGLTSVTAADFNGDGKLDLAAGMEGGVGVLLGNGDGTFGARTDLVCGGNIHHTSVTAGDFNLDGKLDLASAGSFTSSVYLFPGNGNGTFGACTATTVGTSFVPVVGEPTRPQSMTTGDFNRDGKPDLATANNWGISVTVLLNQGNGTFVTQDYPFLGSEFDTIFVGAASVDGDDSLDLLVGHQSSLFVMSGSPSGTFTKTITIALPAPARFAVTGHFDHDPIARTDLLVSSDAGNIVLLRGDAGSALCTSGCTPFVAGSTRADGASLAPGATGGLTIARPGLLRDGDVLYAFLTKSDDVGAIATPAGWTQLDQFITTTGDDFTTGLWRRVVTSASTEPASYRFTHTDTTAEKMSGYIVAVRGANTATPEDAPVAHAFGTDTTNPGDPSVTTSSPLALVLWHEGVTGSAMTRVAAQRGSALLQSTKAADRNSGVSVLLQVTPGPTGIGHWGNSGGSSGAAVHTLTVAVRPL